MTRRVIARDQEVEIEAETVRLLALHQPVGRDLRLLCTVLKVNNDLERIADCAVNIAERAKHLHGDGVDEQIETIRRMAAIVRRMLRNAVHAYGVQDAADGQKVLSEEDAVDALYGQIIRSLVANASGSPDIMAAHLDILFIAKNLERIADHATNIAEDVVFLVSGDIVRHGRGSQTPPR